MGRSLTQESVDGFVKYLTNTPNIGHIDLAGNQGNGVYSERAQFISTSFYRSISKEGGGPGPFAHLKWTEESMQDYYKEANLSFTTTDTVFVNNGKWSVRENPDGSKWRHRTDTKELWMLSPPTRQYEYPKFTKAEWMQVLENKSWPDGQIPEEEKKHSFKCFGD